MTEIPKTAKQPLDHLKSEKKNPTIITAYIANDNELGDEFQRLVEEYNNIRMRMAIPPVPEPVQKRFDELTPQIREMSMNLRSNSLVFQFKSIGRKKFERLIDDNQPTAEDLVEVEKAGEDPKQLRWSPESFFPALVLASCCMKPEGVDLNTIWDDPDWNDAELGELSQMALAANQSRRVVPLGNV